MPSKERCGQVVLYVSYLEYLRDRRFTVPKHREDQTLPKYSRKATVISSTKIYRS